MLLKTAVCVCVKCISMLAHSISMWSTCACLEINTSMHVWVFASMCACLCVCVARLKCSYAELEKEANEYALTHFTAYHHQQPVPVSQAK